jgi:phage tail protein X
MGRYDFQYQTKSKYQLLRGKEIPVRRHFETSILVTPNDIQNDIFIETQRGDRLDLLADKYYGDTKYWYIIANANYIKDTIMIKEGIQLKIPSFIPGINENKFILDNSIR